MAFPTSPSNGATYSLNGVTYIFDSTLGVWNTSGSQSAASPVASVAGRTGAVTLTAADIAAGTFPGAISMASTLSVTGALTAASFAGAGTGLTGTAASLSIGGSAGSATTATTATNLSGGTVTAAGLVLAATDVRSAGQVRATGWYNGASGTYTGLACEIGISGGQAYLLSYNRDNSTYGAFNINATSTAISSGLSVGTTAAASTGQILATNSIVAFYSDERLKTKIGNIENALDKVDQLSGFLYIENELAKELGFNDSTQQVALSAQAVQRVQPEAVALAPFDRDASGNSKSGENYLTVQYERLVPLLVEAIKELRQEVNTIKKQLK